MTLSLLLSCAISSLPTHEPPQLPTDRFQLLPMRWAQPNIDDFFRQHLEHTRSSQAFMKEQFDWMEKFIDESPDIFSPEEARSYKQAIAEMRRDWDKGQE